MDYQIDSVEALLCMIWHKDSNSEMHERGNNGFVICDGSEFSFFCDGKEVIADSRHLLVLPKGSSYNFKCRSTGLTYTYNFSGSVPEGTPFTIAHSASTAILSFAAELQGVSDPYTKIGLMYRVLGAALGIEQKEKIPEIIRPQIDYIQENPGNPELSNGSLAAMTNISEVYFRKLFVRTFGVSPHEYITGLRIARAKQLLLCGKNVSETAQLCGFASLYYFSGAFKKATGKSPTDFVKDNGKKI